MTTRTGYAVLAALVAVVALLTFGVHTVTDRPDAPVPPGAGGGADPAAPASVGGWAGTWAAAQAAAEPGTRDGFAGMSVRNVVHTSIGGARARIQLSNEYGSTPLTLTRASVAVAAGAGAPAAQPETMRPLTFAGTGAVTIPAGRTVTSDPVRLRVPADTDLLVTTYAPAPAGPVTYHPHAPQTSYLAAGDHTRDTEGAAYDREFRSWRYVTAVDVWSEHATGAVAVLGDSLTDGTSSTPGANRRWTDYLALRLRQEPGAPRYGVLNLGLSGNRLLADGGTRYPGNGPSGLNRLDRDVLARTGVKAVVVELGINDILKSPRTADPDALVAGLRETARLSRDRGLRVLGATLMPFRGHPAYTPRAERVRQEVNERIRAGGVFDAVVDFDAALRDPDRPRRLHPAYDAGDHLHLTDLGYREMARTLDPADLGPRAQAVL
ncbi:SGNH/GDSL hydrolase family protein [Streptomyces sp. WMMC500]|uniref:SGNH/GDSL hydrolase family protein n=1 Tax=Streptomyces sp. WMMC500 TaxID=3015154 RepID=UPI00248BD47C|nr:SGNH/GDSL hydrolase family protein [Streptomyces sp. WMMC500]WBB59121.1 SGNH/GDSL hydrolase family protein [Streptomyces sp. WMMC500]